MTQLNLSLAVRDYDRTRPLFDGTVRIDGVDPIRMSLSPEEIFFRAFRHAEFGICELSLSSFTGRRVRQTPAPPHRDRRPAPFVSWRGASARRR
jgi:4,5-dihydroxyphthalate decarboxylase